MAKILCAGEALIDVVVGPDGVVQGEHPGGSVFNVARGLARLGVDTTLASWWGQDARGQLLRSAADEAGLKIFPDSDSAATTPVARATLDANGVATYEFELTWDLPDGFGADSLKASAATASSPDNGPFRNEGSACPHYGHLHLGSYSTLVEPGAGKIATLLKFKKEIEGLTVSYDPNLRPALVSDLEAARARVEEIVKESDLVKASEEDLEFLYPGVDRRKVAEQWLGGRWERRGPGAQIVVVTRGGEGAELFTPWLPAPLTAPAGAVEVVDTVGAGDSFMAGLLAALDENRGLGFGRTALSTLDPEELQECLDFAVATSAATVARAGAYSPTREEISA